MAYIDQYGVQFSDDKKVLEKCPEDFRGAYKIPNSVTEIKTNAFRDCTGLTSIEIPNSVTKIGWGAFICCTGLTSLEIPNSVIKIEDCAFSGCHKLTSLIVDAANNHYCSIDGVLFNYAKNILIKYPIGNKRTKFTIPNSVTEIEHGAFEDCKGLTSVDIPISVTTIGEFAFNGCTKLVSIDIPNSVIKIGDCAFQGCTGLTSVKIPNSVKTIGQGAFCGCTSLISIIIPNSVTTIEYDAFEGCTGLTSITIPNSVKEIKSGAFKGCDNIKSVTTQSCVGWDFGSQVESFVIGEGVEVIPCCACWYMNKLTSINIPNSVKKIRQQAFEGCSGLTSIEIPDSVTEIEHSVFSGCSGLTSIEIPNSVTEIEVAAFNGCTNLREIIVPFGQKDRFSKMEGLRGLEDKIIERDHEKITILLNLAKAYERGIGVQQDKDQAFMFYKQAAEAGSKEAQQWMQEREQEEQQMRDFMEETKNEVHQQSYYLFFDTETTGTPRYYSAPISDSDNWPRLVQIGWIVTNQDGEVIKHRNYIIRPEGFTIPIEASNVHHITTEKALQVGTELKPVLQEFYQDVVEAEHLVGHNIDFDQHIVGAELYRNNMNSSALMNKRCTCTMHSSTNFCAIPSTNGYAGYKWPKLQELYYKLFGRNFEEAHDAMADITATKECFFELKRRGII